MSVMLNKKTILTVMIRNEIDLCFFLSHL